MGRLLLALISATAVAQAQDDALAKSRAVLQKVCGTCHTPESVLSRRSRAQWQETIDKMISTQGAKGTAEEFAIVLDYLSTQYGPNSPGQSSGTEAAAAVTPSSEAFRKVPAELRTLP